MRRGERRARGEDAARGRAGRRRDRGAGGADLGRARRAFPSWVGARRTFFVCDARVAPITPGSMSSSYTRPRMGVRRGGRNASGGSDEASAGAPRRRGGNLNRERRAAS